ncbi:MAB_1171c family putative transporter [Plantactinospora sp. B6F1]|uniref:MAB_1171c family putative transporter n=1 Tax=Plantactinospora sp. B6F1 TaxID=3158971 RepID=UPI0032D8F8EF
MDGKSGIFLFCAGVAWIAVSYKLVALARNPRNLNLWVLTLCIALPAAGFTMAVPAVYTSVNRLFGVPNLASLLVYGCIVGYSITALVMLMLWHMPAAEALPRARVLAVFYGLVLVTMAVLFAFSGATVEAPSDFDDVYGPRPVGGTFLLVYVSAFAFGLGVAAWRSLQFANRVARTDGRPWLRRGLRLVAVGSIIALGYCLGKGGYVVAAWLGTTLPTLSDLGTLCACLGALVITTGFTIPSWGPSLSAAAEKVRRARTYLRLYPLWHAMYQAMPEIALDPPASRRADLRMLRDLDFALYRRVIEIRDGRLALAPYLAPADEPSAQADEPSAQTDSGGRASAAAREAFRIRDALARLRAAHPDRQAAGQASTASRTIRPGAPAGPDEDADLAGDLEFLGRVSSALRRLPPAASVGSSPDAPVRN